MITIKRDDEVVIVNVENGPLDATYTFRYNCGNKWYASLLSDRLQSELSSLVEIIRKEEYERGYREGRSHKVKKEWFASILRKGVS